jgi:Ca2+-binding EF-hand superfamily protein
MKDSSATGLLPAMGGGMHKNSFLDAWEKSAIGPQSIAFGDFSTLVQLTQERYERMQLRNLFELTQDLPGLLSQLDCVVSDILPLHSSFRRADEDNSGTLDDKELSYVLQEFGFLCGKEEEDTAITDVLRKSVYEKDGTLTFEEFLVVIYDIREKAKECNGAFTEAEFHRFDKDRSGQLSVQEVSVLFQEMGLAPTCRQGQDEIKRLIHECDEDHSGELNLEEFQHLAQLVSEKLRSITRFREMELGFSFKFTHQQIRDYRDFFWQIDKDGNGQLDLEELRTLMEKMRQRIDGDHLRMLFDKIDHDRNGFVDFSEFLQLLHGIDQINEEAAKEAAKAATHDNDGVRPALSRTNGCRRLSGLASMFAEN